MRFGHTHRVRAKSAMGVLITSALLLFGCANNTERATTPGLMDPPTTQGTQWPIVIEDAELAAVDFEAAPITGEDRILALAVGSGEIVELLGAGGQLVGRDETSATPENVPVVTQGHQVEIEQALALEPTVVLVDDLSGPPEAIDALDNAGARIVQVPAVWTLTDIPQRIDRIAEAVGAEEQTVTELTRTLIPAKNSAITTPPRVAFLYLRGPSAVYLLGGANTGADALIEAAGATDVGAELGYDGFVPLTAEAIVQADPDVILVMADGLGSVGGIEGLLELPGIAQTVAGQDKRIVVVDDRTLLSFGGRTPALVQALNEAFAAAA